MEKYVSYKETQWISFSLLFVLPNVSLIAISTEYGKIYALDKRLPDELYVYDLPLND